MLDRRDQAAQLGHEPELPLGAQVSAFATLAGVQGGRVAGFTQGEPRGLTRGGTEGLLDLGT